jgi:hypothetical protein
VFAELHTVKCAGSGNSIVLGAAVKKGLTVEAWVDKATAFEKARPTGLDLPRLVRRGAAEKVSIPGFARLLVDKARVHPDSLRLLRQKR